ncbi:purD domain protein [Fibrobacter succinogenes subsp. succinogenes S85]|uniref:PurD domain protein n=1 Tax=Fibrobacter succinogenes (strain ATCC 19169 / S85) TaxID=59374 RepID=D9S903_FIBSS|nr:ATP-grasp domain-containing protein [Fibrobacter succinogenes]ADL26574.1 purD domain protein [Fibrobacter succinogenes subsp. succinogenes S85]
MNEQKLAIVLGGTSPHVLLVNKLKERGYYVLLIDYLENPPAKKVADEHLRESTLDQDKVLEIAKERKADLVISTCIDQANSVCCYVAEKLGLPHPYSYKTSLEVTDKGLMKRIFVENGIPTSNYTTTESVDSIDWNLVQYPAVVKPVDCNSSKGVRRVDSDEETRLRVAEAIEMSRTKTAIIEGFNSGAEIQVDCVSTQSGVKVMMTRQKQKIASDGNDMVLQSYSSVFPAPLSDEFKRQAQEIAEKIANAFKLENTPFFYQAIVTETGIKVLEFAPRIGGGLSYHVLKSFGDYDAVECAIDSFLGKTIVVEPKEQTRFHSTNLLYMRPGVFDSVVGLEELHQKGFVTDCFVMKSKGCKIDSDMRSSNRVAAFIVEGESYEELKQKARKTFASVEIRDIQGNDLLNREIYSNL